MDAIDKNLLNLIQKDARLTTSELADKVGLSASPIARRLRHMETEGIIESFRAHLNKKKLGLNITTFVHVRLKEHQDNQITGFENAMRDMEAVINCHTVSGAFDYLLQVVSADLDGYEQWVRPLLVVGICMVVPPWGNTAYGQPHRQ